MQYYNIAVEDSIAEKVLAFLKSFPQKQVEISNTTEIPKISAIKADTIDDLYGILSPYVQGRLSDEDIENAIAEGAYERGMKGKTV